MPCGGVQSCSGEGSWGRVRVQRTRNGPDGANVSQRAEVSQSAPRPTQPPESGSDQPQGQARS